MCELVDSTQTKTTSKHDDSSMGEHPFSHRCSKVIDAGELESSTESDDTACLSGTDVQMTPWMKLRGTFAYLTGGKAHRIVGEKTLVCSGVNKKKLQKVFNSRCQPDRVLQIVVRHSPELASIPAELGRFVHTTSVCVSGTGLEEFPWPVLLLRQLSELDISKNWQLEKLPRTIGHLRKLKKLDISECSIRYFPTEMLHLTCLKHFKATNNPLRSPPTSVVEKGLKAVLRFLRERQNNTSKRSDLWARSIAFGGDGLMDAGGIVESLQDIALRYLLDFHSEFLMRTVLPPRMKRLIIDKQESEQKDIRVLKCSQCCHFFTTHSLFEMHTCT